MNIDIHGFWDRFPNDKKESHEDENCVLVRIFDKNDNLRYTYYKEYSNNIKFSFYGFEWLVDEIDSFNYIYADEYKNEY